MEYYLSNLGLISENDWHDYVDNLKKNNFITIKSEEEAFKVLNKFLVNAIKVRVDNLDKFGLMFSGGLDCSIIAKVCQDLGKEFTCYTIGFEGAKDIIYAKKAAKLMDLKLKVKILDIDEFIKILLKTISILKSNNPVYTSIGCVSYASLEFAKANKEHVVLNGLGAEEIFCGYQRHLLGDSQAIHEESWRGLREMWEVDLERDYLISKNLGINVLTPFMDKDLIVNAMRINPSLKINNNMKKIILRRYAEGLSIPKEIAYRPKTAGQYGSKINSEIKKIAKKNNFVSVKDYLETLKK